jgi:N-methylhydantoinase A/oxoprolinase/acetone carboxylase beta subunit
MNRLGIDVGGTNTDAVLVADGRILHAVKVPTTADVTHGIVAAMRDVLANVDVRVDAVMIGTTHFVNAVVQRRSLAPVAVVRVALPATAGLPPFTDWPDDLAECAAGGAWLAEGGHDYDGRRFMPLDVAAVRAAAREIRARGLTQAAVAAMFSPLTDADEEHVAAILREEVPGISVTCSSMLGGIGLLERENAAALNAAIIPLAQATINGFTRAMLDVGIDAPLYITQNDGTVAAAAQAVRFPVWSFASGPTNSMRGAAYLSQEQNAVVVDVGGTTTDFGHLQSSFPRQANTAVQVGGVRTLFRMPDVLSIGLGGGSLVDARTLAIGPRSVGYRLTDEALVFGGTQLTMTDVAVAAGLVQIGERSRVHHLPARMVDGALARAASMVEEHVDRVKTEACDVTLIAVGGGAFLVPPRLAGVRAVVRLEHGGCANAVGAAIAQVSGEVDQVFQGLSRDDALAQARVLAEGRAVAAGAAADRLLLVEAEDIPIAYLPGNAMRVRVKVVGDIG